MKISCISFTASGSRINHRLEQWLEGQGEDCDCRAFARYAKEAGVSPLEEPFQEWCRKQFSSSDALIFIGAAGIAVRGIAPWVRDKRTDPAVLVIDEQGKYVISLLSGHIGGANEMTEKVAAFLGAEPVITTATDINKTFAVDVFARKNQLIIDDMKLAKEIAACLIDKKPVGFVSELPVEGEEPSLVRGQTSREQLSQTEKSRPEGEEAWTLPWREPQIGIHVTLHRYGSEWQAPYPRTLRLIPQSVHMGIGCRKGTASGLIEEKVQACMEQCQLDWKCIAGIASTDLKKEEPGLLEFAASHNLPFTVYSAEELMEVEGNFTASAFVGSVTGVDNVCERAAALDCLRKAGSAGADEKAEGSAAGYRMIQRKTAGDGVTVALAMEEWRVRF